MEEIRVYVYYSVCVGHENWNSICTYNILYSADSFRRRRNLGNVT